VITVGETRRVLPFFQTLPLTDLPLLYHQDHLFPYSSFDGTESVPVPRDWRVLTLENEWVRVEVAPELGGRVHSFHDKRIRQELLFRNPVVRPVRIPPLQGFISGGIEFNFPITHSPTSIAAVGSSQGVTGDYGWIRVGEREVRTGMEWVVELGLHASSPVLVQRTALRNPTRTDHPWSMWTIAAVRSTSGTEFIHPGRRVLVHDRRVTQTAWPGSEWNWDRNIKEMTALFWEPGSAAQFGAFHHELGFGLMHLADPGRLPGRKVWTYGHGRHRDWGRATTEGGESYAEIESSPLPEWIGRPLLAAGREFCCEEFWVPVHSREACDRVEWPDFALPPLENPWLGWAHSPWQLEWESFRVGEGPLPCSAVPTGLELEDTLKRELARGNPAAAEPLAQWLAFRGRAREALDCVGEDPAPTARRLAGLILWKGLEDPRRALTFLRDGPPEDPVAVVELDTLLAELGETSERAGLLSGAGEHRLLVERRADLALAQGRPELTLRLLEGTRWPRELQRYVRTDLWRKARERLGRESGEVPESLNEDSLARHAAHWPAL
jgi:hypothetical protein